MRPDAHADAWRRLQRAVLAPGAAFSIGGPGALAEFSRIPGEPARIRISGRGVAITTARGALALLRERGLHPRLRRSERHPLAREVVVGEPGAPGACGPVPVTGIAPLGRDAGALARGGAGERVFDLGLGLPGIQVWLRTDARELIALLTRSRGVRLTELSEAAIETIKRHRPARVFVSRLARIEVYQPIPPPHGASPAGPHTHLDLERLARAGRVQRPPVCLTIH